MSKSVEADKEEVLKSTKPFMERVMSVMEANYMNSEFGVQEFCDALGMSRTVVSKHLNAEVGLPAGQFIRNYRLNMAKEMLSAKTGNRNITEIAYAVGFNDPKYFTRWALMIRSILRVVLPKCLEQVQVHFLDLPQE